MLDKIKGGLIGFAIGDAMGVATEFMTSEEIKEKYGVVTEILGGGVFGFECGETSDDTDMTVAVAKGIIANSNNPIEEIGKQFLKWKASNPKDIGITISTTFMNYQGDWFKAAEATHHQLGQSGGNGTLMRCIPIAFAYSNPEKMDEVSVAQSKMTHYEDSASEACIIYNHIARRLLQGEDLKASILAEINDTRYDIDYRHEPECHPNGYVVNTLKWVFYWLLIKETFIDVITGAVNMGDDSDTIAAIAGGLKGIEVGYRNIPYKHVDRLKGKYDLEELAEVLYRIRDMDTLKIQENHVHFLQEIVRLANHCYEIVEQNMHLDEAVELMKHLEENLFLYRASLKEDEADFEKKYPKWWTVCARFRRSKRLLDLGAPKIIIQHGFSWLKLEANHLDQIHQGIEPQYTSDELEELESLAQLEREMEEEQKRYLE
ncbi:ADP-ribosylglycohydrolase family protein [Bacillus sp. UNC438CL73TsuS30]|uniref:ADP-ribosylglycohydrolase family protein n=1 Tax=Bacillus sp. UNC438CL73TsuS30 TaxID=1340434 RepID=UPI0009DD5C91|nr:ADP-ribosylglycohydrolase family protein [Bacillus sp. UNC438CL73TsuS30]